jgi:hypothetical protein
MSFKTAVALLFGFVGTWWLFVRTPSLRGWRYEFPRDASNYGLSPQQCDAAFPGFFGDIQSAVASRKQDPIRLEELEIKDDQCLVRVLIYDSEVSDIHGIGVFIFSDIHGIGVFIFRPSDNKLAAFHSPRSPEQEVLDGTLARTNERLLTHDPSSHHHRATRLSTQHRVHTRPRRRSTTTYRVCTRQRLEQNNCMGPHQASASTTHLACSRLRILGMAVRTRSKSRSSPP